ncbi:MAG TPA: four helix bundle protein [Terriglobia bacterium]|nr:four helix bundle protein [Terriglobia bacterium]
MDSAVNIAEGWGRGTTREYIQFLLISRGSLMELETDGIIAMKLGYASELEISKLKSGVQEIGRMLNGLVHSLRGRKVISPPPVPNS